MATGNPLRMTVVIAESVDGGYLAYVKELPGCIAQGETVEEAKENILDVAEAFIETLFERAEQGGEAGRPGGRILREETYHIRPELVPA